MAKVILTEVVRGVLELELDREVTDQDLDRPLDSLGLDSLSVINVVNRIEDELGILLPTKDIPKLAKGTGNQLADYVQSKV